MKNRKKALFYLYSNVFNTLKHCELLKNVSIPGKYKKNIGNENFILKHMFALLFKNITSLRFFFFDIKISISTTFVVLKFPKAITFYSIEAQ